MALHYRHVAVAIARQLKAGRLIEDVIKDRARGYTTSTADPVTGGRHCAIGGGESDFIVTSTLASQCPPAVGRALGISLSHVLQPDSARFPKDAISFVSVGDGSVNNAHFLSAVNMAEYARARKFKCPILFGVSDNDICISLHGFGWLGQFLQRLHMPVFEAVGLNVLDVHKQTEAAAKFVRGRQRPALIVYRDLPRRFAHSGNDREEEYRSKTEIAKQQETTVLAGACHQAVQAGVFTYPELLSRYEELMETTKEAFADAAAEPKNTSRTYLVATNSAPLRKVDAKWRMPVKGLHERLKLSPKKGDVMRKHMTATIGEALESYPELVYIGEDVGYGGYYKVTDGLSFAYPKRVRDFPPDETSLVGAAIGYSQVGLLPVVEIPYAKYLDCGADMFFEAAIMHWLSNGISPNGMLIRLQGFGPGVFGGNFHTHNSLHMPPGLDVVCYSNGRDYVRGWRYALEQAKGGRLVMSVDCTDLLNRRHVDLDAKDSRLLYSFPEDGVLPFSSVVSYDPHGNRMEDDAAVDIPAGSVAIITYGTGIPEALKVQRKEKELGRSLYVIDTPLLSEVPQDLREIMPKLSSVLFADICKDGGHPYATTISRLQSESLLPSAWQCIAATPSYNPLGTYLTFTGEEDIQDGLRKVIMRSYPPGDEMKSEQLDSRVESQW
ncbi:hypothetical protein AAMO2058_000471300 [Amorphochlora amoebiformis]